MASICASAHPRRGQGLGIIAFVFAPPIFPAAVDQSVLLIPDSNLSQHKDFLKQFSTKDFLKDAAPPPLEKEGPQKFFVNPQTPVPEHPSVVIVEQESPACSIPLLEKHAARNPDPKGTIKIAPGVSDRIA